MRLRELERLKMWLENRKKAVCVAVATIVVIATGGILWFMGKNRHQEVGTETVVESVVRTTQETTQETTQYVSPIDFATLKQKNKDIFAYIKIPGTKIDYPIVWNGDNEYYLHHDLDGKKTPYGSIYMDMDDRIDLSSRHNIFYGHHMKDKTMFQNIVLFKDKDFFEKHRDIYIYTPQKEYHLRTIACLYTDADASKRRTEFASDEELNQYVDEMTKGCSFRSLPQGNIGSLWSFITCSYEFEDARTILYACEV